jgi:predicted RNA-binding protein
MCLSTVWMDADGKHKEVMRDVASIEARDDGFVLTGLFGDEKFIQGRLQSADFVGGQSIFTEE